MLKGVLFDWDGTLCDTLPVCINAFRAAMEPVLGRSLTDEQITEHFGVNELGIIMLFLPNNPEKWQPTLEAYNKHYRELHYLAPKAYEGLPELLQQLKNSGIKVGLVTGKAEGSCAISLEKTGLKNFFAFVRTGSEKGVNKKESIDIFLEKFKLDPKDVYYVGDSPSDMSEANRAGVHSVAVLWSSIVDRAGVAKEKPEFSFDTVSELKNFFENLLA